MDNTSLDAPTDFIPNKNDRPAGQWMEAYWAQIVPWAKYLAYIIWACFALKLYTDIHWNNAFGWDFNTRFFFAISLFFQLPLILLGYFCFRFAQNLEGALAQKDQWLLEEAFQQLYRFLITSLVTSILWIYYLNSEWQTMIQIISAPLD
jgi:hypothetical protein